MALVRHIIALRFAESLSDEEKRANAAQIKTDLERLKSVIPGILEFRVYTDLLQTSNMDLMFDSTFESESALAAYQIHPEHVRVAEFIRSVMLDRTCMDFHVDG